MSELITLVVILVIVALVASFADYDSTDDAVNKERSGLSLFIDYGTGLHYIKAGGWFNGTLMPRLDANGKHIREGDL